MSGEEGFPARSSIQYPSRISSFSLPLHVAPVGHSRHLNSPGGLYIRMLQSVGGGGGGGGKGGMSDPAAREPAVDAAVGGEVGGEVGGSSGAAAAVADKRAAALAQARKLASARSAK